MHTWARVRHISPRFRVERQDGSGGFRDNPGNEGDSIMRRLAVLLLAALAACSQSGPEAITTSVDVGQTQLPALLADLDAIAENDLDIAAMLALAVDTPMDGELQERFAVSYGGAEEEILFHTWREQEDWVHLYFSSTSSELISAIEASNQIHARSTAD